jgi:HEAT repeat protein
MNRYLISTAIGLLSVGLCAARSPVRAQQPPVSPSKETSRAVAVTGEEPATRALAPWDGPASPEIQEIAAALRASRKCVTGNQKALLERIAKASSGNLDALMEILIRARVPETRAEDAPQILSDPQRSLLLSALSRTSVVLVRSNLDRRLEATPTPEVRLAAVHALGAVGGARDLGRIVEIAPRLKDGSLESAAQTAVRAAAAAIFARDPTAVRRIRELLGRATPAINEELVFALGSTRDPRRLSELADIARNFPKLGPLCVSLVRTVGSSAEQEVDRTFCIWMVDQIPSARPDYQCMLLQSLGILDDGSNVAALVEELGSESRGVRDSALWALKKLTGLSYAPEPAAWKPFLDEERTWMDGVRPRLQLSLRSGTLEHAVEALRELGDRRIHRAEIAGDVAAAFDRPEPELRQLACEMLARLASPAGIAPLCNALDDSNPTVADAAWQALSTLGGIEPPRDRDDARVAYGLR